MTEARDKLRLKRRELFEGTDFGKRRATNRAGHIGRAPLYNSFNQGLVTTEWGMYACIQKFLFLMLAGSHRSRALSLLCFAFSD